MSCKPSSASGVDRLISMITCVACWAKAAELPTDMVGMMAPAAVMAVASMTAISTAARLPERSCSAVSDRCWSMNMTSPLLILPRKTGSTWNGMRRASTPASAIRPSLPLPSEAPVIRVRLKGSCRARSASARGRALASPARVKPLMPTRMPLWNNLAASSALMILPSKPGWRIRSSYIVMLLIFLIFSNWMAVIHQPHKWNQYKIAVTCMA